MNKAEMKYIFLIILIGASSTHSNAINPDRTYKQTPDVFGLRYSQYKLETSDHYSINVWEYQLPDSVKTEKTVIFVGTDAGNMSYLIGQANAFIEKGIRVIAFDYRGFGQSSDFEINKNFLFHSEFATDLDTVIKATRAKYPTDKVGLYALSMGTYISLIRKEKIDFLIQEGFYNNPQEVIKRIKLTKDKTVLLPTQSPIVPKPFSEIPTIIFCSATDKITTKEDAKAFRRENVVKVIEYNGDHLMGFNTLSKDSPGDLYMDEIMKYLKYRGL